MHRAEIIAKTLMEMNRRMVNQPPCPDEEDSAFIISVLQDVLPEGDIKTCEDFQTLNAPCCQICHANPHYEMSIVLLRDGSQAWVCDPVKRALHPQGYRSCQEVEQMFLRIFADPKVHRISQAKEMGTHRMEMKNTVQVRLTSATDSIRASLEPFVPWIEEMIGVPLGETLTLESDCNPGDCIAENLLPGLPVVSTTVNRNNSWRSLIDDWSLPVGLSPNIAVSLQRERKINAAPFSVWELDWKDTPIALKLRGLRHKVISVKVPLLFPPGDSPLMSSPLSCEHWFIAHREDAAKVLLLQQKVMSSTDRYLETKYGQSRLQGGYNWDSVVLDATTRTLVRNDFEIFFQREEWFRQHNLPYRRGYLFWGPPGNGKSATIKIMASHPYVQSYSLDLSDLEQKSAGVAHLFDKAAMNAPSVVILEDIDRAFPNEGKRTQERMISFQTLLNCLDGVGSQDGVLVIATANDPTCLDAAILKRPGRFDRVVQFRNPVADLRREYYRRLSPVLTGEKFETAIEETEGFSFAQLRETYILGAQLAFSDGRDIGVADVLEAIGFHAAGTQNLKTSVAATGFVSNGERATIR